MLAMNKRTVSAVTLGVWIAALGSAAALAFTLNRAPHGLDMSSPPAEVPLTTVSASAAFPQTVSELPSVVYVPIATIVGQVHRPLASAQRTPATDIAKMHCTDWRGLDIGSGHVQVCQ
jgi:hypothetical protein